jgi:Mn2+/Fe2+ NRAMP family transporter
VLVHLQVVLSLQLPFAVVPLVMFTSDPGASLLPLPFILCASSALIAAGPRERGPWEPLSHPTSPPPRPQTPLHPPTALLNAPPMAGCEALYDQVHVQFLSRGAEDGLMAGMMGTEFVNSSTTKVLAWVVSGIILLLNVVLLFQTFARP